MQYVTDTGRYSTKLLLPRPIVILIGFIIAEQGYSSLYAQPKKELRMTKHNQRLCFGGQGSGKITTSTCGEC